MLLNGNIAKGKQKLLMAIRINPWNVKPYIYLALSLLGKRIIPILVSWKRKILQRS